MEGFTSIITEILKQLNNPDLMIINCSGDDDVVLKLADFNRQHGCTINTVRPGQEVSSLNNVLESRSEYLLFAELDKDIDMESLYGLHHEVQIHPGAVFCSSRVEAPRLFDSLLALKKWLDANKSIDCMAWACSSRDLRKIGGIDSIFGTAYLKNVTVKLVGCGPIKVLPAVAIATEYSGVDNAFFSEVMKLRLQNDLVGLSTLYQSRRSETRRIGKEEEAVVSYYFGRVKLRARQFRLAQFHFINAFKKYPNLKYLIFWGATFLPSSSYSFFANMVNRIKRI